MSWLRSSSFRTSSVRQQSRQILRVDSHCDPTACFDSFREHWQQTYKIIQRSQHLPSHDDVLGVVNHLEQMVTLLLWDGGGGGGAAGERAGDYTGERGQGSCLDYLLSEHILSKLYEWGLRTGRYANAVRLEQLKLYEMLVSQSRHQLLVHEPFLRPLLRLLTSCQDQMFPADVEKRLVLLLNQLCVLLMQNIDLLDLFFCGAGQERGGTSRFVIFSLLVPFIHREGAIGMQARDALLLCMSLSKKNAAVGAYIANHSNVCVLLASGLNGLYSNLPHALADVEADDWHRFTPDDVNDIRGLASFMNSLEFCNAVAQVAHPLIGRQLHDYLYSGFLIPVMGPSLLQPSAEEQLAATAYLELLLRSATQPGILLTLVRFLVHVEYDGARVLDVLTARLASRSARLALVTLALFETLVALSCEDVMLELVFRHLQPCMHLMLTQRRLLHDLDPYCRNADRLLLLVPACCVRAPAPDQRRRHSLYGNYHAYLCDARHKIAACGAACASWANRYDGCDEHARVAQDDDSLGASSGYESFRGRSPEWQTSLADRSPPDCAHGLQQQHAHTDTTHPTVGPFINALFDLLENMLTNTVYVNIHLTGLFSRLAIYSQPLLRTYLLNHKLVLQPNVRSLFQVIGTLKKKLDEYMWENACAEKELQEARWFLIERETRLFSMRKRASESAVEREGGAGDVFRRDEGKRRSLSSSLSSMFRRASSRDSEPAQLALMSREDDAQAHAAAWYRDAPDTKNYALTCILLEEWLKELAAISQEHTISQLTHVLN